MASVLRIGIYEHKAPKGLIRVTVKVVEGVIEDVRVAGDFFVYPEDFVWSLEEALRGMKADPSAVASKVGELFKEHGVVAVGSNVDDFVNAITQAVREAGEAC